MKRAIIYGRKSTNKQSTESIETQIYECEKWAKENNCLIVDIYDDSGQSGRAYNVGNRSGFQQILADAKAGRMDYALIHKVDRFARSVLDYLTREAELLTYGVTIIAVGMPFFQEADIITKSIYIAMAEQFSVNLSDEVSKKMRTFAKKGVYLGGGVPYGFKLIIEDGVKKFAIDEEQAIVIKRIFELYMQSYGYVSISKILKAEGITNAHGRQFSTQSIKRFLCSKRYNGYYVYGQYEKINGKQVRITDKKKLKDKLIEIPDVFDKIIDDVTFQAVQERMQSKAPKNKRKNRFYSMTGKIRCNLCGASCVGSSHKSKGKEYCYYRCCQTRLNKCNANAIRADFLEDKILSFFQEHILNADFSKKLIKEVEKHLSNDVEPLKKSLKHYEKELLRVNEEIKEASKDKYGKRIAESLYNELMDEYDEEKVMIERRIYEIKNSLEVSDRTKDVETYVTKISANLKKAKSNIKAAFLQEIVYAIVLSQESAEVFINLTSPSPGFFNLSDLSNITGGSPTVTLDKTKIYFANSAPVVHLSVLRY